MPKILAVLMDGKSPSNPLGLRFEIENSDNTTSLVDVPITDIPKRYHEALVAFPRLLLYERGEYYATEQELNSGVFVDGADPADYPWLFTCFDKEYFDTDNCDSVVDMLQWLRVYSNLTASELYALGQSMMKYLTPEKFSQAVFNRFPDHPEAGHVIRSIFISRGTALDRDVKEFNKFVNELRQQDLIPVRALPPLDKGFDSLNYSLPLDEAQCSTPEAFLEAFQALQRGVGTPDNIRVCTGRGECYTPAGFRVKGKVLAVANQKVNFFKNANGEFCVSQIDKPKLVQYVSNYETMPLRARKSGKRPVKSILVDINKIVGIWVHQSAKHLFPVAEQIAKDLNIQVFTISL